MFGFSDGLEVRFCNLSILRGEHVQSRCRRGLVKLFIPAAGLTFDTSEVGEVNIGLTKQPGGSTNDNVSWQNTP